MRIAADIEVVRPRHSTPPMMHALLAVSRIVRTVMHETGRPARNESTRAAGFTGLVTGRFALVRGKRFAQRRQALRAFPLLARAARAGIAEAEFLLGCCYFESGGVPKCRTEAVRWYERAATHGYVEAQSRLAALCVQGLGISKDVGSGPSAEPCSAPAILFAANETSKPDFVSAEKWARSAAEAGCADAQALLGFILSFGPDAIRNPAEAQLWYRKSAEAGSPQGAFGYALCLNAKAQDEDHRRRVTELMQRAAKAGLPGALYLLGDMTERGVGVERNPEVAAQLYRQSAEGGDRNGQARWGLALLEGRGVERNAFEGESWIRRAALAGDIEMAALLGQLYAKEGALPPNYAEAAIWFRRAAEGGHPAAARIMGLMSLTGTGRAYDKKDTEHWLRVAAAMGDKIAQIELCNLVLKGLAEANDQMRTREWFEEAAESGNLSAAFNYGVCLANGIGVERDEQGGKQWIRRAAEGGLVIAQRFRGQKKLAELQRDMAVHHTMRC